MAENLQALGMIETKGLVGSIEAADAMHCADRLRSRFSCHSRF